MHHTRHRTPRNSISQYSASRYSASRSGFHHYRAQRFLLGILIAGLILPLLLPAPRVYAAPQATPQATVPPQSRATEPQPHGLSVQDDPAGVAIRWQAPAPLTYAQGWPAGFGNQIAGDTLLPLYTLAVWPLSPATLVEGAPAIHIQELGISPYHGPLPPAPSLEPIDEDYVRPTYVDAPAAPPVPTQPLTILRTVTQRGQVEVIVAFNPIYLDGNGQWMQVDHLSALVADTIQASAGYTGIDPEAGVAAVAGAYALEAVPPANALARQTAWKVTVTQGGIQQLRAADLAAAGLNNPATNTLALYRNGQEVALHIIDTNSNGRLDAAGDAIRFYAPAPGDLWNSADVYWLAQPGTGRKRITQAAPVAADAAVRNSAFAAGSWRAPRIYNSNIPGPSGDYWFHLEAIARTGVPVEDRRLEAAIAPALPLATGTDLPATLAIDVTLIRQDGSSFTNTPHSLRFTGGDGTSQTEVFQFAQGGARLNTTLDVTLVAPMRRVTIDFLLGERPLGILFDQVHWQQPVDLNFRIDGENRGAAFRGLAGAWRYRLRNLPANALLYNVTDPLSPALVPLTDSDNGKLFGGNVEGAAYVVAGPGTIHQPGIRIHNPVANLAAGGAHALYIAPEELHSTLTPLLDHRRSQGYSVALVDVQAIYDSWSYGQVSPAAIRNFLRHAVSTWRPAPISVVLVGDGTHDPRNYLGYNNPNLIPPYMAHVDPHTGQTACDSCYGQLDGADPLSESSFAMDIWVGRLPVINPTELRSVVNKIIRYETATDTNAEWRRRSVQIADDYFRPDGQLDGAGDFVASAELINALKPSGIQVVRNYFNVAWSSAQLDRLNNETRALYQSYLPWFVHNPDTAWTRTIQLMNAGAGLVTFTGHANHWRWAETTNDAQTGHLFGLNDVNNLTNLDRLFIGLSMTCYTSLFSEPAPAHATLDERLVLRPSGGAVATLGPSGLSTVVAHDHLQIGFHEALWDAPPMTARMGELIEAGYANIRRQSCCQEVLQTFLLLGDPLTPARVGGANLGENIQYLPTLQSD